MLNISFTALISILPALRMVYGAGIVVDFIPAIVLVNYFVLLSLSHAVYLT